MDFISSVVNWTLDSAPYVIVTAAVTVTGLYIDKKNAENDEEVRKLERMVDRERKDKNAALAELHKLRRMNEDLKTFIIQDRYAINQELGDEINERERENQDLRQEIAAKDAAMAESQETIENYQCYYEEATKSNNLKVVENTLENYETILRQKEEQNLVLGKKLEDRWFENIDHKIRLRSIVRDQMEQREDIKDGGCESCHYIGIIEEQLKKWSSEKLLAGKSCPTYASITAAS